MAEAIKTDNLTTIESEIRPSLAPLEQEATDIEISDQETYDQMCLIVSRAVDARVRIKERLAPGKSAAHKAWKEWVSLENQLLDAVAGAERVAKDKIGTWDQEQQRLRLEEQRRLEEQARKEAEEQKLADALAAESEGAPPEEVESILDQPEMPAPVYAQPTYEKAKGVSTRETWKAEVTNLGQLIQFVATSLIKNPGLMNLLSANMPSLNAMARAQKGLLTIPGVRAVKQTNVAVRR